MGAPGSGAPIVAFTVTRRPWILLSASSLLLVGVLASWALWPRQPDRADLVDVTVETTVTTTSTTTSTTAATAPADPPAPTTTTPPPPTAPPTRLRIDSIGVDARVVPVGLADDGMMEIPPAHEVGWYRLGPAPGEAGSAVLAGHVDLGGQRGAFFELRSVEVGAEIVVDGDGTKGAYVVTAREQLPKDEVDLRRYFTAEGPDRITLITCGGAFDRGVGHYTDNIILTAEPRT